MSWHRLTQICKEFNTYNEIYDSFAEMGLQENLLKGIYAYGNSYFMCYYVEMPIYGHIYFLTQM
jgi:hypothetical protein